jgi:hypothetical protein
MISRQNHRAVRQDFWACSEWVIICCFPSLAPGHYGDRAGALFVGDIRDDSGHGITSLRKFAAPLGPGDRRPLRVAVNFGFFPSVVYSLIHLFVCDPNQATHYLIPPIAGKGPWRMPVATPDDVIRMRLLLVLVSRPEATEIAPRVVVWEGHARI